jgi:threonine/homoserine/homoserine lactone efflux protein
MDTSSAAFLAQSLLIGLSIAAPVGPIGLLTIQRSLDRGWAAGFATGMGAAVADGMYGAIGAFGVASVVTALVAARTWLTIAGVAFIAYLAWGMWRREPAATAAHDGAPADLGRYFLGTLLLTLSNPLTILSFVAIFASMSRGFVGHSPWLMIFGVFAGSAIWWLGLSLGIGRLRERFDLRWRRRINRFSAALLLALALWQLLALLAGR